MSFLEYWLSSSYSSLFFLKNINLTFSEGNEQ